MIRATSADGNDASGTRTGRTRVRMRAHVRRGAPGCRATRVLHNQSHPRLARRACAADAVAMEDVRANPWIAVFRRAVRQHGAITRAQAVALGVDGSTFVRRVRGERWQQPHGGVYLVPGAATTLLARVSAALLAVGDHAAVTGLTALHLHGVVDRVPPSTVLVVPHSRRAPRLGAVRVRRTRTLPSEDLTRVAGLRCTTPPRALLDATPDVGDPDVRKVLIDGRQRNVLQPADALARAAAAPVRLPGRRRLIAAAIDVDAVGADSVLTDVVHRALIAAGLAPDPHPVTIEVPGGRRLHPDITFADARVCIEVDSLAHHGDQRSIDFDHRKDQAYADVWWRCLRVGWRRADHDMAGFVAAVDRQLVEWPRVLAALGV